MTIANDWIRTGHSMRLSRPSDSFHQGTACLDSIDNVAREIVRANRTQRELYEKEGIGKGLLQPISQHGWWISPLEKGYGAVMTTDLWPEQTSQQAAECIRLLFGSLKGINDRDVAMTTSTKEDDHPWKKRFTFTADRD